MSAPTAAKVVCEGGSFTCKDQGKSSLDGLSPPMPAIKLTVGGSRVVTVAGAGGAPAYTGCTFSDNNGSHPCISSTVSSPGATKLTVGHQAVLLSSDSVRSVNLVPAGAGAATVDAGQTKMTAQ